MKTSSVPDRSAFTVEATPAGGSEETLDIAATSGVNITSDTVVLTMAKPMAPQRRVSEGELHEAPAQTRWRTWPETRRRTSPTCL